MVTDDSDEMLGARLDSALRSGLANDHVDVAGLLTGSRRRARRVRNQRIALAAAAGLVVAVPVGYEVLNPGVGAASPPAAMLPSGSRQPAATRSPVTTVNPRPTAVPSVVPPAATNVVPTLITQSLPTFTEADLPAGLVLERSVPTTGDALVAGQECGPQGRSSLRALSGRQWTWSPEAASSQQVGPTVSLTVTSWAAVEASTAFQRGVSEADGYCRWLDEQKTRVPAGLPEGDAWSSTSSSGGGAHARTLIRVGNGIVGIQVQDPAGAGAAAALADRLAGLEASRLRSS